MLPDFLSSPFQEPALSTLWTRTFVNAYALVQLGIVFFLFTEILKRLPFQRKHNFKLAHSERPFFNAEIKSDVLWPLLTWIILLPAFYLLTLTGIEAFLTPYVPKHRVQAFVLTLPFWVQVLVASVVLDLALYVRHRFVHLYAWPYHIIHHSAKEITWTTWLRLHPGDSFIMGLINVSILWVLGFDAPAMVTAQLLFSYANSFNHANIQLDYGSPLRYIFVSPNMHRWHHGTTEEALNKNFCIIWAWIDILFGTFYLPPFELPERYGAFDEDGEDCVGPTWLDQFFYPFRAHWKTLQTFLARH